MMRVITLKQVDSTPSLYDEAADILRNDGLVCFPGRRQYSIAASLMSPTAVIALVQSKRRSAKAPSLVLIPDASFLPQVVQPVPELAYKLAKAFWPGALTLALRPSDELPSKVKKVIGIKPGKIGVRVAANEQSRQLLTRFGGPLLISSANLSHKGGAGSASNVRKNFHHTVDLMIDAGDIPAQPPSTIVDLTVTPAEITREGILTIAQITQVIAS